MNLLGPIVWYKDLFEKIHRIGAGKVLWKNPAMKVIIFCAVIV